MIISELAFWYGLTFNDIANTPLKALLAYIENLEAHKAEKSVFLAEVEVLPQAKESARKRMLAGWRRTIQNRFGSERMKKTPDSPQAHRAMLAVKGVSVQLVNKETKDK